MMDLSQSNYEIVLRVGLFDWIYDAGWGITVFGYIYGDREVNYATAISSFNKQNRKLTTGHDRRAKCEMSLSLLSRHLPLIPGVVEKG